MDVYHQPQLSLQPEDYDIVGSGLSDFVASPFDNARFEIGERGVDLNLEFVDKMGRTITLRIHEHNPKRRKPFGLLAPFPGDARNSPSMPLALLYDFYFVRRSRTDISIKIGDKYHQPDMLPAPIDGARVYFVRYSPDPFIVLFNQRYDGLLPMKSSQKDENTSWGNAAYETHNNDGFTEIVAVWTQSKHHQACLTFTPAFPDVLHLKNEMTITGTWHMDLEQSIGYIGGTYRVQCNGNHVEIEMHPAEGWHPRITKLSVWVMFKVVPIFRHWPKSYRWHATIDLSQPDTPQLSSRWSRIE